MNTSITLFSVPSLTPTLSSGPQVLPQVPSPQTQVKLQETEIISRKLKGKDTYKVLWFELCPLLKMCSSFNPSTYKCDLIWK